MKYIVDGYNLIFGREIDLYTASLYDAREKILQELNEHAESFSLDIIIVFDAVMSEGLFVRKNYFALEVVYTGKGETADDYIIHFVEAERIAVNKIVVVTSDKGLARRVRGFGANTLSINQFMKMLRKKRAKKTTQPARSQALLPKEQPPRPQKSKSRLQISQKGKEHLPKLADIEEWEAIFEEKYKETLD